MIKEGTCIYPLPNKKPCGKPCLVLDQDGNKRMFCYEHKKLIDEWIARVMAKRSNGVKTHFVANQIVRHDRGRGKQVI